MTSLLGEVQVSFRAPTELGLYCEVYAYFFSKAICETVSINILNSAMLQIFLSFVIMHAENVQTVRTRYCILYKNSTTVSLYCKCN